MPHLKTATKEAEAKMNMTPMIDIVFQLLIFFTLVSKLEETDREELYLPKADQARPDIDPGKGRMTINVSKDGRIKVKGFVLTIEALGRLLKVEGELFKKTENAEKSDKPILIRADREAEYGVIQQIMLECVKYQIWKLSFAASASKEEPGPE